MLVTHSHSSRNGGTSSNGFPSSSSSSTSSNIGNLFTVLRACALSMASLYVGFYLGYKEGVAVTTSCHSTTTAQQQQDMQAPLRNLGGSVSVECPPCPKASTTASTPAERYPTPTPPIQEQQPIFPKSTASFIHGMSLVDRNDFAAQFDTGVPLFDSSDNNNQVVLLHGGKSLPRNSSANGQVNRHLSVQEATKNCNYLSLILTQPDRRDQCIAIMGQYNSYHISKFMRLKPNSHPAQTDASQPLELVKRGTDVRPFHTRTPDLQTTETYWKLLLQPYLTSYQTYLDELKPLAKSVVAHSPNNHTLIVMVSNQGQSELLRNFVCNAQARGLDLSMILVFATDVETQQLSQGLGLQTYYNQQLFQHVPQQHAARFGDATYKMAIFSKLYCVHLIGLLGYDYLFQDVDMIWYRHPLDYFHQIGADIRDKQQQKDNHSTKKLFDMYMQNDGNYAQFYMPYAGNTGFYFVRNTPKTQFFMNSFVAQGDYILSTSTHQAPFISVLSEHASLHGLKVKILPGNDFPGGAHYQGQPQYMKYLMKVNPVPDGTVIDPWIFHMSWTDNKVKKIKFFQQMGEWYVPEQCMPGYNASATTTTTTTTISPITEQCCSATPVIQCHFRDKASIIPCHDSPPTETGKKSFYPEK